jgi:hypothetical protein
MLQVFSCTVRMALVAAVAAVVVSTALANIIAVDLGSDAMKVALVKPGLPFHVVNNFQSKRKVRARSGACMLRERLRGTTAALCAALPAVAVSPRVCVSLQTPVAMTYHDGERFFGADAQGLQTRRPESTFVVSLRVVCRCRRRCCCAACTPVSDCASSRIAATPWCPAASSEARSQPRVAAARVVASSADQARAFECDVTRRVVRSRACS